MKKILSLICVLTIIVLIGCSNQSTVNDANQTNEENKTLISQQNIEDEEKKIMEIQSIRYVDFEELIAYSTDVIKGKCISVIEGIDNREYEFQVIERYSGEDVSNNIFVYQQIYSTNVIGTDISYNSADMTYEVGQEYYLVLSRYINVLYEHDRYNVKLGLFVPVEDVQQSTMYGEPLIEHSDLPETFDEVIFKNYIVEQLNSRDQENIKLYGGQKYTLATDMQTIIDEADCVLKIKTIEGNTYLSTVHDIFKCTVTESLKGEFEANTIIDIFFAKGTVETGQEFIVAVDYGAIEGMMHFSSKNSLYSTTQYDVILNYINQ